MARMRSPLLCLAPGFAVVVALAGLAGIACKEGEGSRCEVDADCRSDLVCNKATDTCQNSADIDPDASFEPDAMVIIDASDDAQADAPADAGPDAPL